MTIDKSMIKRLVTQTFPNGGDKYFDYEEEFDALCRAIEAAAQAEKQEPYKRGMTLQECADAEYQQEPVKDAPVAMLERDPSIGRLRVTYEDAVCELGEGVFPLYTRPQPDLTAEVERLKLSAEHWNRLYREKCQEFHDAQANKGHEIVWLIDRIAALEAAAREARDALQYKLHVVEAIAKLDAVLGNAELKRGSTTPTKASDA